MKTGNPAVCGSKNRSDGAVTVEYAVVFPIVLVCIMLLVYIGILNYQQCLMQSAVNRYADSLALLWGFAPDDIDFETGITERNSCFNEELYWHLYTDTGKRAEKTAESLNNKLISGSVMKPRDGFEIDVKFSNNLICKKVCISAIADYYLPFAGFIELLGFPGYVNIEAYSEAFIYDPPDFIQNTDYLLQIYKESGAQTLVADKLASLSKALQYLTDNFR